MGVLSVTPGNAQHQGSRDAQEDSFAFSDLENTAFAAHGGALAVLSDGMGGLASGGPAGAAAVRAFLTRYEIKSPAESIPDALTASMAAANDAVLDVARGSSGEAGATLVAAVV